MPSPGQPQQQQPPQWPLQPPTRPTSDRNRTVGLQNLSYSPQVGHCQFQQQASQSCHPTPHRPLPGLLLPTSILQQLGTAFLSHTTAQQSPTVHPTKPSILYILFFILFYLFGFQACQETPDYPNPAALKFIYHPYLLAISYGPEHKCGT